MHYFHGGERGSTHRAEAVAENCILIHMSREREVQGERGHFLQNTVCGTNKKMFLPLKEAKVHSRHWQGIELRKVRETSHICSSLL